MGFWDDLTGWMGNGSGGGASGAPRPPGASPAPRPDYTPGTPAPSAAVPGGYSPPSLVPKNDSGLGGLGLGDPARSGGQYEGLDRNNFNLPGYDGMQDRYGNYLNKVDNRDAPQIGNYQTAGQSGFRGRQDQLANLLMDRAQGNNSVAEQQLHQGLDLANQQQMSLMAGARPSNTAMAMRLGGQNMANNDMGLTGQAALARAQEAQMAANSLGGVLAQGRGADEGLNMFNAGQNNQRQFGQAQMDQNQMGINDAARQGLLGGSLSAAQLQQQGGTSYESNRTQRYGAALGVPTQGEVLLGGLTGAIKAGMAGGG